MRQAQQRSKKRAFFLVGVLLLSAWTVVSDVDPNEAVADWGSSDPHCSGSEMVTDDGIGSPL